MKKLLSGIILIFAGTLGFSQPQAYYNGIDFSLNGIPLKNALATRITSTHTRNISYAQVWTALKVTDLDPQNSNNVILVYGHPGVTTGTYARTRSKNSNGGATGDWNREHTYAKSLGTPDLGESGPGADAHHLRASDVSWNGARGSKKFAAGSGNSGPAGSNWYPGDEWKGDIARMMMYMYVRYNTRCLPANVGVGSTTNTPDGMIDLFLEWNAQDPVSEIERQRNTYLATTSNTAGQGNRNPFIDNPYLATKIWGGTPAEDTWGTLSSTKFEGKIEFAVYPNPTSDNRIFVQTEEAINNIKIVSIDGKVIQNINQPLFENNQFEINNLSSGFYFIVLNGNQKTSTKKFIVN